MSNEQSKDPESINLNVDEWFDDTVEVKRDSIKSKSKFTKIFQTIIDNTIIDTQAGTNNYLFYNDFILFLNDNFLPYIFIWSGFIFRNLNFKGKLGETITHITQGSIEKEFGTIKNANGHLGMYPAEYVQTRVTSTLTNCLITTASTSKNKPFDQNKSNK